MLGNSIKPASEIQYFMLAHFGNELFKYGHHAVLGIIGIFEVFQTHSIHEVYVARVEHAQYIQVATVSVSLNKIGVGMPVVTYILKELQQFKNRQNPLGNPYAFPKTGWGGKSLLMKRRVKAFQRLTQVFPVEVGIDLSRGDAFMSKHFLYGTQVGPAFYQVCGKGMPERMR